MRAQLILIPVVLCLADVLVIPWPWGAVAVAGSVALSVLGVWVLARVAGAAWWTPAPQAAEPLRVVSVRLDPEVSREIKAIPGKAVDAITSKEE